LLFLPEWGIQYEIVKIQSLQRVRPTLNLSKQSLPMLKLFYIYNLPGLKRLLMSAKTSDPSQSHRSLKAIKKSFFVILLIGKFRRFYLFHFRKKYVQEQLAGRKGECRQCAQCCDLLFPCPMKTPENRCRIYNESRWEVCKVFPIDKRDVRDVALCGGTCGYSFDE